jgi:tetratricopeptide (TPR) repeat protein
MKPKAAAFVLPLLALSAATAWACLWDTDTLQMERMRFPGVLEIITGKFVRHSRAYYDWRITDRQKKLATRPDDPALVDDLAVAYAKLGRPEEGIPLLERVLKQHPDRYETLSNLGTLLFFAGRLDESKATIRRALEINPNAHFGRIFQLSAASKPL